MTHSRPPDVRKLLKAGLSAPVAIEAVLRERTGGKRLGHWCYLKSLHASTVSAVIRGKRSDSTIRAILARELGLTDADLAAMLDPLVDGGGG